MGSSSGSSRTLDQEGSEDPTQSRDQRTSADTRSTHWDAILNDVSDICAQNQHRYLTRVAWCNERCME